MAVATPLNKIKLTQNTFKAQQLCGFVNISTFINPIKTQLICFTLIYKSGVSFDVAHSTAD